MVLQQKLLEKAYFIVKITVPAMVRQGTSDFRKASRYFNTLLNNELNG